MLNLLQRAIVKSVCESHWYGKSFTVVADEEFTFSENNEIYYSSQSCDSLYNDMCCDKRFQNGKKYVVFWAHSKEIPCWEDHGIYEDELSEYLNTLGFLNVFAVK